MWGEAEEDSSTGKVGRYYHSPVGCVLLLSQCRASLAAQRCLGGLTAVSVLDQAADSGDDNDPIQFMSQTEHFNLNAHPEGQDEEFNGVVGADITMYGELNLIAEPQKVRTCAVAQM